MTSRKQEVTGIQNMQQNMNSNGEWKGVRQNYINNNPPRYVSEAPANAVIERHIFTTESMLPYRTDRLKKYYISVSFIKIDF